MKKLSQEELAHIDALVASQMAALNLSLTPPVREPEDSDENWTVKLELYQLNCREAIFRRVLLRSDASVRMIKMADNELQAIKERRRQLQPTAATTDTDLTDETDEADIDDDNEGTDDLSDSEPQPVEPIEPSALAHQELYEEMGHLYMWRDLDFNLTNTAVARLSLLENEARRRRFPFLRTVCVAGVRMNVYIDESGRHIPHPHPRYTNHLGDLDDPTIEPCSQPTCRCRELLRNGFTHNGAILGDQKYEIALLSKTPEGREHLRKHGIEIAEDGTAIKPDAKQRSLTTAQLDSRKHWRNQWGSYLDYSELDTPEPAAQPQSRPATESTVPKRMTAYRIDADGLLVWPDGTKCELPLPKEVRVQLISPPPGYVVGSGEIPAGFVFDEVWYVWKKV